MIDPQISTAIKKLLTQKSKIIIAIDGRGGAGKSSLAKYIKDEFPKFIIVEYDWFHNLYKESKSSISYDSERLCRQIILPYLNNQCDLLYERYNWGYLAKEEDLNIPAKLKLDSDNLLLIEGCMVFDDHLIEHYDLKIWLNTSPEESFNRGTKRDIQEYKLDPEKVMFEWNLWQSEETKILATQDRSCLADLIINNFD